MIRVLIVEDDPMVAELNKRYLKKLGGFETIEVVRTADEAQHILKRDDVDLVLLDVYMPGMNGVELLSEIRKNGLNIDVIMITAASDKENIEKVLRYGIVDYLIKPFEFERFSAALIAYRDRVLFMKNKDTINQEQLDQLIHNREQQPVNILPKGLDKKTFKKVWESINYLNGASFTTEELAGNVGISRVSMRKYLEFLNQAGILDLEILYGSVGRPVYRYKCIDIDGRIIKHYL